MLGFNKCIKKHGVDYKFVKGQLKEGITEKVAFNQFEV